MGGKDDEMTTSDKFLIFGKWQVTNVLKLNQSSSSLFTTTLYLKCLSTKQLLSGHTRF